MRAPGLHAFSGREPEDPLAYSRNKRLHKDRHPLTPFLDCSLYLFLASANPHTAFAKTPLLFPCRLCWLDDNGKRLSRTTHFTCGRTDRGCGHVEAGASGSVKLSCLVEPK